MRLRAPVESFRYLCEPRALVSLLCRRQASDVKRNESFGKTSRRRVPFATVCEHERDARPASIRKGTWCPYCAPAQKLKLEGMQQIARERGGECISKTYKNCYTNLVWECARGHRWKASPTAVKGGSRKRGTWCLKCANLRRVFNSPGDIEKMRDLARARGGRCLSREYVNSKTHIEWECEQGHRWRAVPRTVSAGSWCPICARNQ